VDRLRIERRLESVDRVTAREPETK
jgi:hypothetical protein